MNAGLNWYILYTKPNCQRRVINLLTQKSIEAYCPLHTISQKRNRLKRSIDVPLFTSYVFVYCSEGQLSEVRTLSGVINTLYWLNKPAIVSHEEIETIRFVINNHKEVLLFKTGIRWRDSAQMNKKGVLVFQLPSLGYTLIAHKEKITINSIKLPVEEDVPSGL